MNIYIGHSKDINYIDELYKPIREFGKDSNYNFILPHEKDSHANNSRDFYNNLDLFIAEVSLPATGLGIELGWAYDSGVPIYCIYKKGNKVSNSIKAVTNKLYEYETNEELIDILNLILK
ncbi:MAG: hypothetical protein ACM3O4_02745 [Ignavibacteriales bacterium]